MKIAIVNDSSMAQEALKRLVGSHPEHEIIWVATNGLDAVNKTRTNPADVILMDLVMPQLDGAQATRQIMKISPCPIIIVTASTEKNKDKAYEAMGHGAIDVIRTPSFRPNGTIEDATPLMDKITRIAAINSPSKASVTFLDALPPIVAIGASTGGPQALLSILSKLSATFPAPIVITQHVDSAFAKGLSNWLNNETPLDIQIVKSKTTLKPGNVYIAATNDHLCFTPLGYLDYTPSPIDMIYRPSIDVFFKSLALHYPKRGTAILLTGMGQDGAEGMLMLKNKGWHTIVQDENSSIVFSMPRAAIEQGAAEEVLPLSKIPASLLKHCSPKPEKLLAP